MIKSRNICIISGKVEKLTNKDEQTLFWLVNKETINGKELSNAHVVCLTNEMNTYLKAQTTNLMNEKNVVVQGKLATRKLEDSSGKNTYRTEVVIDNKFDHTIEVF